MNMFAAIALVACAISPIFAQNDQIFNGTCPPVTVMANFNESLYAGNWYEIKRYENKLITGECSLPEYDKTNEGFNVTFTTTNLSDKKNTTTEMELKKIPPTKKPGEYNVFVKNKMEDIPYRVLDTDYKKYSVVTGCKYNSTGKTNIQRLSIFSRDKKLEQAALDKAMAVLKKFNLDSNSTVLLNVEQDDKKCGRSSATTLVLPTILTGVIAMLLTKKF